MKLKFIILLMGVTVFLPNSARAQTAPTMNPSGGTFVTQQEVSITTPDTNVVLRYTVDGTSPTTNSLTVPDTQQVLISQPTTIKAAGFNGATRGAITTNTFSITGQIAAGAEDGALVMSDGTIWMSGDNSSGELGNGNIYVPNATSPVQVPNLSGFVAVACGAYHVLALNADGTVWSWGYCYDGELGVENIVGNAIFSPMQITLLSGVKAIAAGYCHSIALKTDGTVWAWGGNYNGQLGNGTNVNSSIPVQVLGLTNIVAISAGGYHSLALDANGKIWGFGNNADGELGLGTTNTQYLTPQLNTNLSGITTMIGGGYHSLFVKNDGTVWACGLNSYYQLSSSASGTNSFIPVQVSGLSGVTNVSAGEYFSAALKSNGTIWTWGQNSANSLGLGSSSSYKSTPVQVTNVPSSIGIACGMDYGFALRTNGVVYAWGDNGSGQLGFGTQSGSHIAAASGFVGYTLNETPPSPTGLMVNYTLPTQATLSWTQAGSVVQNFTVQFSTNNGTTWTTTNTVDASQTSEVLNGLNSAANYKFRIIANGTYSSSAASSNSIELVTNTITGTNVAPATLTNTVTIASGAGTVSRVDFYEGNTYLGSDSNSPYTMVLSNVMAGPHTYTAIVNNTNGEIGLGQAAITVDMPYDPMAAYRFVRGPGTNPLYQSYVMSIDELAGVGLDLMGNNSEKFTNGLPWFVSVSSPTLYQLANSNNNAVYTTAFQNPIAAFGAAGGGTPLYTGQSYHFAFGSGGQLSWFTNTNIQIKVYAKSQFSSGATNVIPICTNNVFLPQQGTSAWNTFAQNGYTTNIYVIPPGNTNATLITTIQYDPGAQITDQYGDLIYSPLVITHKSTSSAFYYEVNYEGISFEVGGGALAMTLSDPTNGATISYGYGYTLDFTDRPAWVSTSLSMPTFNGTPMPPEYAGKSIDELLNVSTPVIYQFTNNRANYLTLDVSPELRTNPVLDKFVADMGSNPITLANYVLNQIHLSDAISYNEAGSVSSASINAGGVNRSALATFLEKEGSPTEQCALLIYFLRKCGVPSAYVFPTQNSLQMLDARMSTLLRVQLNGDAPVNGTGPQLLPVNYPWVAAYDTNSGGWVHIFPWLKDTSITQGYNIDDYLPSGYNTGYGWLQHYLYRDSNILSLSTQYDNPGTLYPLFVSEQLALSGLTTNDVGVTVVDRSHNYNSWSDFPQPWSLASNSLNSSNLVESLSSFTNSQLGFTTNNIFNTFQCQIFSTSRNSTNPILDTQVMRMVDLHNRKIMMLTSGTNTNSMTLQLSLDAIRPGTTNVEAFPANGSNIYKQLISTNLISTDDALDFRTIYNRNIPLGSGFNTSNTNSIFLGIVDTQQVQGDRPMRVGDAAVLCLDYGRVTQDMVNVQAQNYWNAQQIYQGNTNVPMDSITAIGTPLYIAGMTYYKRITDFKETLQALHDISDLSFFASGFSKMSPLRNAQGKLTNGPINLIQPNVDMSFIQMGYVGNSSIDPVDGITTQDVLYDWFTILMGEVSAQEHMVINTFYGVNDSASTVHLLSDAQTNGGSIVALNSTNFIAAGNSNYSYNGTNQSLSAWAGTTMWSSISNALTFSSTNNAPYTLVYVTPGPVLCASNTYLGMGAFIMGISYDDALISDNMTYPTNPPMNGGWGPELSAPINGPNYSQFNLSVDELGNSSFQTLLPTVTHPNVDDGNNNIYSQDTTELSGLISGTIGLTQDQLNLVSDVNNFPSASGGTLSFSTTAAAVQAVDNAGLVGTGTIYQGNSHGGSSSSLLQAVADPVNVVRGDFYVNDTDLVIPGPMPIQFSRNYDSQNLANNEFGTGWKTGYFAYLGMMTNSPLIYAAEMDGSVVAYRLKTGSTNTWIPYPLDNPTLCNQHGDSAGSVFNLFNNNIVISGSGTNAIYTLNGADGSKRTFAIQSYPLTGTNNITRQRPYLQSWIDPQGNQLSFSFGTNSSQPDYGFLNRISASNGNFLQLDYDTYGHIISANAADGRRLAYGYDTYGDLISVTRPDGSAIGYTYQHLVNTGTNATGFYSTHLLTQVNKPEGWILVNMYDGSSRVTNQQSTVGTGGALARTGTFSYSSSTNTDGTLSGTTQVTDAYNHTTTYTYAEGQLTQITDPLSQTIQTTWYTNSSSGAYPRSLAQRIDKRGLTNNYLYDSYGNLTNTTTIGNITATGSSSAVKTTTYNTLNLPTQITEPNGNYEVFTYGSSISPYLVTKDQKYASGGGLISETDTTYTSTGGTNIPYANGLVQSVTQGVGSTVPSTVSYTYNSNGYPASETHPTGTGDPTVSYTLSYNLRGQLIKKVDAAGQWTGYAYDDLGNQIWEERHDDNGNLVSWNYKYFNENSQISWTQGCRYNPCDYSETLYDDAGRVSQILTWNSQATSSGVTGGLVATTTYTHDLFGNLTQIMDPIGTVTTMGYDAIGQMTNAVKVDSSGHTLSSETFTHEPGGNVATHVDVLGGTTTTTYTQTGQPETKSNPNGTSQAWQYQIDSRLSQETLPNGSTRNVAYNDGSRTVTTTLKDSSGNILSTEVKAYDALNNLVSKTDGEGYTFTTTYDGLSRPKVETGPVSTNGSGQQIVTHSYNAAGLSRTDVNALGESTITSFDATSRPLEVDIYGANGALVRSTGYQYSPDHQAVYVTEGKPSGSFIPVATTTYTDFQGNPVLVIKADGGRVTSVYDANENLVSKTDELGQITTYAYDGLNHLIQEILPDNAITSFGYDAEGNMTNRSMPAGLTWTATFNNASQKTYEKLSQGSNNTRSNSYTYYGSGNKGAGQIATLTDPRGIVTTYNYDAFGRATNIAAADTTLGVTRSYTYDRRNLLTEVDQSYQNTNTSLPTKVIRTFDGYGAIASEQTYIGTALKDTWQETHDIAGRRLLLTELNNLNTPYNFQHDAAGNTISVILGSYNIWNTLPQNQFFYTYNTDGRLSLRQNNTQTIKRDAVGRITNAVYAFSGTTYVSEQLTWNANSTESTDIITRAGATNVTDSRAYSYSSRGLLTNENFNPSPGLSGSATYQFDTNTSGGLGLRTGITLGIGLSGQNYASYGNFARLTNETVTGPLTNNLGALSSPVNQSYDSAGNVTNRTWGAVSDSLTWDAFGQLVSDTRTGSSNNFTWNAVYDGLGRRLQTTQGSLVVKSSYDPEVEYLELGVTVVQSSTTNSYWKVYGPDISGQYGGMQGTGGLDGVYTAALYSDIKYIFNDTCGNAVAVFDQTNAAYSANPSQSDGYGALPGSSSPTPISATNSLGNIIAWRDHYIDPTGYYYLGARYYAADSGTFLSPDPLGHAATMDLYSAFNGDPINVFDPDGRFGKGIEDGLNGSIASGDPSSPAFGAGNLIGGALSGVATGAQNGAGGDVNALTLGNVQGAFGSDPNSDGYAMGRNIMYGTEATVAAVVTGGIALEAAGGTAGLYSTLTGVANSPIVLGLGGATVGEGAAVVQEEQQLVNAAESGVLNGANYAQRTFSSTFSSGGTFAGQTVEDVAAALRSGTLNPADVPIQYIVQDGNTLMLNTRSAQALEQAGIPRSAWNAVDMSGDAAAQARLAAQLQRNGLGSQGIPTVTPSGH